MYLYLYLYLYLYIYIYGPHAGSPRRWASYARLVAACRPADASYCGSSVHPLSSHAAHPLWLASEPRYSHYAAYRYCGSQVHLPVLLWIVVVLRCVSGVALLRDASLLSTVGGWNKL